MRRTNSSGETVHQTSYVSGMNMEKSVRVSKPTSAASSFDASARMIAAESASICRASFRANCSGVRTLLTAMRTGVCNPNLSIRATSTTLMPGRST